MFKKLLILVFPFTALILLVSDTMDDNGKAGRVGAPGEQPCTVSCHNDYTLNSGPGSVSIQSPGMPTFQYTPGTLYHMSVTVAQAGVGLFGCGVEALLSSGANGGAMTITDAASTHFKYATIGGNTRTTLTHQMNGGISSNSKVFIFDWTAPAAGTGNVTFYFAGNAADGSTDEHGDYIYTSSQIFTEACQGPSQPATITGNQYNCDGDLATYTVPAVAGATSYAWTLPSGWTGTSTTNSITVNTIANSGSISVAAVNGCGSSTPSTYAVTVNPLPVPSINQSNDSLYSNYTTGNQWYFNGNIMIGWTNNFCIPTSNGNYTVEVIDAVTTCHATSPVFAVTNVGIDQISNSIKFDAYPNPAIDKVSLNLPVSFVHSILNIYSITGQQVFSQEINDLETRLDLSQLAEGSYTLVTKNGKEQAIGRILISRD